MNGNFTDEVEAVAVETIKRSSGVVYLSYLVASVTQELRNNCEANIRIDDVMKAMANSEQIELYTHYEVGAARLKGSTK